MNIATCVLALVALPIASPADSLRMAAQDLHHHVPAHARGATRYISLYHVPPGERADVTATVSFVLNSVSRSERIVVPDVVANSQQSLLRVCLDDYGLPLEVWELLALQDAYWHLRTQVIDPADGRVREVFTDGGWIDLSTAAQLRQLSGSAGALVRADYFLVKASTTLDGGLYYALAGIAQRESEYFAALGIDTVVFERLAAEEGANLIRSGVTHKLRRIARRQGPLGGAWQTFDVERNSPQRDPLRNPFRFEYDATEHIAAQANGLQSFALYDRAGRRQDSVPDAIAKDASDPHGAGIIAPMLSCVRCHVEEGLRPFDNDQRRLLESGVQVLLDRPENARRLESFYLADLELRLRRDREDYAAAVAAATGGRTVAQVAGTLARIYDDYAERLVDLPVAARELGVAPVALGDALARANDPVLLALRVGLSVQRQQWESVFGAAALLVAADGVSPIEPSEDMK